MVLDISIEPIGLEEKRLDHIYRYFAYTVRADHHRILTLYTTSDQTLSKWLNDVVKSTPKNAPILVGVTAEHRFTEYTKRGVRDHPFDLITLCVGSQCLLYSLPDPMARYPKPNTKPLRDFFENPRVVAVGMEMETVATKLERHHGIKVKNAVDVRGMAVEGLKEEGEKLDLWRYDLDKVAKTVLGKHVDLVRPEEKVEWYLDDDCYYHWWNSDREMNPEKVQFATIDAYLCYLVGSELHEMNHGNEDSFKSRKKKEEEKKKKKKK